MSYKSSSPRVRPSREKPVPSVPTPPPVYRSRSTSETSSASFTSARSRHSVHNEQDETVTFSPEEENAMRTASADLKTSANKQFAAQDYIQAISTYDRALAELPNYLNYELAVLQSNIAACHIHLKAWKDAIEAADSGLENLDKEWPLPKPKKPKTDDITEKEDKVEDDKIVELDDTVDQEDEATILARLNLSDQKKTDITRIRTKLLLRRARARVSLCDERPTVQASTKLDPDVDDTKPKFPKQDPQSLSHWSSLSGALEDYTLLYKPQYFSTLPQSDKRTVLQALQSLPPRIETAKKKEMDEMMGKLKDLGNMVLKPFGFSTDMFKATQDPVTGGWSLGFDGKAKK